VTALPAQREDGRTARSRRTRTAVVDALLALQEEGCLAPTAQQVAARAGVALRTVFGHFSDMETLWAEAGRRELQVLADLADEVPADLPLAERVQRFAASRAVVLERLMPVMRAARLREPGSRALTSNRQMFIAAGDAEAARVFAPEIAGRDDVRRRRLLDAVGSLAGGPAWEALRLDRGLPVDAARDQLARQLTAVLDPDTYREDPL
jgi:TetR/AcrR family transcriptional regulator, regulator of autoinduction and epiphytic fitness